MLVCHPQSDYLEVLPFADLLQHLPHGCNREWSFAEWRLYRPVSHTLQAFERGLFAAGERLARREGCHVECSAHVL